MNKNRKPSQLTLKENPVLDKFLAAVAQAMERVAGSFPIRSYWDQIAVAKCCKALLSGWWTNTSLFV